MHTTLKAAIAVAAAAFSLAAAAQPAGRQGAIQIDERQARQDQRIERAFARGDLSRREVRSLRRAQREIVRAETQALADGRLNRRELAHLTALLDSADQQIRQLRRQPG